MKDKCKILGVEYRITEDSDIEKLGFDGLALVYKHEIKIRPYEDMLSSDDDMSDKKSYFREVLRHECLHALFAESGSERWENDEDLVTWISKMYPKIESLFAELGCAT